MRIFFSIFVVLFFLPLMSSADVKFTILHTSDIHGHFTNQDSPIRLGGIARLKTKIDYLRKKNQNTLLLDSGDWSEGTIFYTLNSGEANHRMMEAMGYDAIVLGNHEWLVGPKDLYEAFDAAKFKVPVLSANLNMPLNNSNFHLEKYIKPYVIKEFGGKKIGILGLSTFELIYDPFFEPVAVTEPIKVALKYVKKLREEEKCDAVIVLSHMGIDADKSLAEAVPGIDIIVGGHTHLLMKRPIVVNGVPIVHIGTWAQYVGEYELSIPDQGKLKLLKSHVYQIDETEAENDFIKGMVEGFQKKIEELRGNIFSDKIFRSEVNLPLSSHLTEDAMADWAVDAIRRAAKTDVAFDVGQYYRRDLFPGTSSTVDFYNMFPHIFNKAKNKSWTILTMSVKGQTLTQMINLMSKLGMGIRISGGSYRIDNSEALNSIKDFVINGQEVDPSSFYKVAATQGVFQAFDFLKKVGADVGVHRVQDTGIEAWRVIKDAVVSKSPITANKIRWEGRVRTIQPDIYVPLEQVVVRKVDPQTVTVRYKVINAGIENVKTPSVLVKIDLTPKNTLDEKWATDTENAPLDQLVLKGGRSIENTVTFRQPTWDSGYYSVSVETNVDDKEVNKDNNRAFGYFQL